MKPKNLSTEIRTMLKEGASYSQISKQLNVTKSSISYHANKLGLSRSPKLKTINDFDWTKIQEFYNISKSAVVTRKKFRIGTMLWMLAKEAKLLNVKITYKQKVNKINIQEYLNRNPKRNSIKSVLLKLDIFKYECFECHISEWNNKKITLQLEHKNGINNDNRLENLCLLCPNCHSQTSTYAGKNLNNPNRVSKQYYKK